MSEYDPLAWERDESFDNCFTDTSWKRGWTEWRTAVVRTMIGSGGRWNTMLDVGCCDGLYVRTLRSLGWPGDYVGVDITPRLVAKASELAPEEDFRLGDIRDLQFESDSFDMVFCNGVLQHVPDLDPMSKLFDIARKFVFIGVYGAYGKTESGHTAEHLNWFHTFEDITSRMPEGWRLESFRDFERPNWPIFQYLFRRETT